MEETKHTSTRCPRCGKTLPKDAPDALCASCLLAAGAETITRGLTGDESTVLSAWADSASAGDDAQRLAEGQAWGPYRIGRLLGRGGMGEVYEAEHHRTGRRIALKVLRSRLQNSEDRARFLREGQLAASVSHPHTVYIFGSEEIAGMPVISMELLPGGTLKDKVVAQGPLPPSEAVAAVLDIIGGLDAAQSAGILHRDIKPSNCFLDNDGSVKVGDFGLSISTLARDVYQDLATNGFQGTPQFAPPEQLRGEPLDVRADIYAVGATLYYLLTGHPPFDARNLQELFARVKDELPKSPKLMRPDIPQGLASVVMKCLAKTPSGRPASYAALADAIRPFLLVDEAPAKPSLRLIACIVDSFILAIPLAIWQAATHDPIQGTGSTSTVLLLSWIANFLYFLFMEGFSGATLGKMLFRLRVSSADGGTASFMRIGLRTIVFQLPRVLSTYLIIWLGGPAESPPFVLLVLAGITFATARRHNGWAAIHDLASDTRVFLRSEGVAHRVGAQSGMEHSLPELIAAPAGLHYGPFRVVSDAGDTGNGRLFVGFDLVLRRQVWIHTVPVDTPPISNARRDVSRAGRLHWLTGRRSADENWDAFEAPNGVPFLLRNGSSGGWPIAKLWLLDLANELAACDHDGSTPALGLDRVWLRNEGSLVLLDFAIPGTPRRSEIPQHSLMGLMGPMGLLSAVAAETLPTNGSSSKAPAATMPLSARTLIQRWSSPTPPTIDAARDGIAKVAAAPDRVGRWRRAVPIVLAAAPILLLVVSALLVLPYMLQFLNPENSALLGWLDMLSHANPPAGSRLADPEIRDALERYVAGTYSAKLKDATFWNSAIMQQRQFQVWRRLAAEIAARHPSVTAEELNRVTVIVAPEIEIARQRQQNRNPGATMAAIGSVVVGFLMAASALLVLGFCLISSLIVPGGAVTRMLGLAVVTHRGTEISRWQSVVRVLVAWLPMIVWFGWLVTGPRIQGFVPNRTASLPAAGIAAGILMLGAVWAIARPTRGLHDRIVGTWIVPR